MELQSSITGKNPGIPHEALLLITFYCPVWWRTKPW